MKVLVADDDPVSRRLLQSYLIKWGHEVTVAENGAEAWRLFEPNDFPLVISDWMMPRMDGLELIRRIRACEPPRYVYLILVTSRAHKEDLVQGMDAGADDFITKPFDRDELRVRLREGERIICLERSLAEQNQALRQVQEAVHQLEQQSRPGPGPAGTTGELRELLAGAGADLGVLRREVLAVLSVLSKYREGQPDQAAEAARREGLDLALLADRLTPLLDRPAEAVRRAGELIGRLGGS